MEETSNDLSDHLPVRLVESEIIPPAPNRTGSAIDFLPEFAGYAWIGYGASSLLVISHFPSPLSSNEALIGPLLRQHFQLSGHVSSVCWSPVTPSKGDIAAAADNRISIFSHDSQTSTGSFCWSQTAVLVQATKVEAIKWTGSGDGIVSGGHEVVLWKNNSKSWEIAWKFKMEVPQTMVSATWSIEGPSATVAASLNEGDFVSPDKEAGKCVSVCQSTGNAEYTKAELHHPQSVSMIQWRPSTERQSDGDVKRSRRNVLLTCCLDGTVRLWCEIDNGRVKKSGKDRNGQKTTRQTFCVAAVIEINQTLIGTLGADVIVEWATEVRDMLNSSEGANQCLFTEDYQCNNANRCDWLIGVGPGMLISFWAIRCLDDISPMRFPRVTLWKSQEVHSLAAQQLYGSANMYSIGRSLLNKIFISRNQLFAPPTVCSLIQLLPCNSFGWSILYTQTSKNLEDGSLNASNKEYLLSCQADRLLDIDGHSGVILKVAVHPDSFEEGLLVSLDSNGWLLFWSFCTIPNCPFGSLTLNPSWTLCGKFFTGKSCPTYTSLRWAPSVLDKDRVLLMGHIGGIDCYIVKLSQNEEERFAFHHLCTIPCTGQGSHVDDPVNIFAIPLPSTCQKTFSINKFLLLGVWKKGFQALSWEITLHSFDLSKSICGCDFDSKNNADSLWRFDNTISGRRYCVLVDACSSQLPDSHIHRHVTAFAALCPVNLITSIQRNWNFDNALYCDNSAYHMATGYSDGSVKFWRSYPVKQSTHHSVWELVGVLASHQGPIIAIALTDCGRKIATICTSAHKDKSTLQIWVPVHIIGSGTFVLEDTLSLDGRVIALNWLDSGSGQFLLGVCTKNELQVYAQRHSSGGHSPLKFRKSMEMQTWCCLASAKVNPSIHDFLWMPGASPLIVQDNHFCSFGQWLSIKDKTNQDKCNSGLMKDNRLDCQGDKYEGIVPAIFTDSDVGVFKELFIEKNSWNCQSKCPVTINKKMDPSFSGLLKERVYVKCRSGTRVGLCSIIELAEESLGSLPVYHPESLLMNIYLGNWKRARLTARHLIDYFSSDACERGISSATGHVPQVNLSEYFEGKCSAASTALSSKHQGVFSQFSYSEADASGIFISSSNSKLSGFDETVEKLYNVAAITDIEKTQILAIIDLINELSSQDSASVYGSLDEPGRRFWVAVRFQRLYFHRRFGRLASTEELDVDSGIYGWGFHSDCQKNLFDCVLPNEPSWNDMQAMGVGYWFTNVTELRSKMEKLARSQFLKTRDPKACALLYIALNRVQVLAGLFKISKDEKDKPLVAFLSRNFQEEKNKAAALKNAYVLMGRHQLELAIAFFLLGGDTSSALAVCAKNLGDEQLALVICRLVEGHSGPLERNLVSKSILPSAIEKGDYWLASLLEWASGNYSQSFLIMLDVQRNFIDPKFAISSSHVAFLDPSIGRYCLLLATTNSMRNALGEQSAGILARWATLMMASALDRCGLPLEGLECLSSFQSNITGIGEGSLSAVINDETVPSILKPSPCESSNWLSGDAAYHFESLAKVDLALKYFSKLMKEHPSWPDACINFTGASTCHKEYDLFQYEKLVETFGDKLFSGLEIIEQRFSLSSAHLVHMILIYLGNNRSSFVGYNILRRYLSRQHSHDENHSLVSFISYPDLSKLLWKATKEISFSVSRFIVACSISCSQSEAWCSENSSHSDIKCGWTDAMSYYMQDLMQSIQTLRNSLHICSTLCSKDLIHRPLLILDIFESCIYLASAWMQKNMKGLILIAQPFLLLHSSSHNPLGIAVENLKNLRHQVVELLVNNSFINEVRDGNKVSKLEQEEESRDTISSIPLDERWQIMGACLWQHISSFMERIPDVVSHNLEDVGSSSTFMDRPSLLESNCSCSECDDKRMANPVSPVSNILVKLLRTTIEHNAYYHAKQLASFVWLKAEDRLHVQTLSWLAKSRQSQSRGLLDQDVLTLEMINHEDDFSIFVKLWGYVVDKKLISEGFAQEKIKLLQCRCQRPSINWSDICNGLQDELESELTLNSDGENNSKSAISRASPSPAGLFWNGPSFLSSRHRDTIPKTENLPFQKSREIYKRNGELFEALCINSIDQRQAAIASNKKGILFFHWEDHLPFRDQSVYIWSEADWPQNGWAGSDSTLIPTCVSPGVGLGIKKGAHPGLGQATVGIGSSARPGRDLTGGGAFGVPGYAGIGASGLGWEIQEDYENSVDTPATVENINTRAFSSHPSRPFFLVGSSNTHIYLWEFGKDKATATYGVLPAANIPPPYALASISALEFDVCGHRFATAALDGTICTWQLEVGGRSNIRPTESSLCFNNYASDVTYVTTSGSIIAAAGFGTDGVNVVIWDTLAPTSTARASIMCHEGGAHSLSVFDNDIGSGSISPFIVTGGKGGDVGLHDFRYIATGKTKRHKHFGNSDQNINTSPRSSSGTVMPDISGEQNVNGMLWYIPKAHLGSVTKISTIPNTSLFLTGSKDGDVKLWDAKRAKLVFHWSKLHERRTFLQPSTRAFGGVVQAAVTDIQVVSHGFLTCGGDGSVKMVELKDNLLGT